ncbi:hypothetical protein F3Y39_03880 [Klebsiella pneumoniae]|nr:hypothetical protein F3Y39_03880 [Klebsiella pneumoniae]
MNMMISYQELVRTFLNTYRRLISELSQISEETIESLVPMISNNMKTNFPASGVSALEDD